MKVYELKDYFTSLADHGNGDAEVFVCDCRDNPLTESNCVCDALLIDSKERNCFVVLQTEKG